MGGNENNETEGKSPEELLDRAYHLEDSESAKRLYRDWAKTYDAHLEHGLGYTLPETVTGHFAEVVSDKSVRVLDVGCGTGLTGQGLVKHGFSNLDGLDFSAEMLAEARRKEIYNELIEADLTGPLAIEGDTYGAVISTGTFTEGHVGAEAFDEIFRIIVPGGWFVTSINAHIWEDGGFGPKIFELSLKDVMRLTEKFSTEAFVSGDDNLLVCVFEKC
ncbi:MAG: class I SAM-dependent DNA methyltransferase [Hyphomicrobiales bacterium]